MQKPISKEEYARLVNLAGRAAIVAASLLIIVKLLAWFATGSSSILAALTDSLMDVTTSIINLFAIKIALQPADEEHRFGHGKAESLAGLAQAAFISGSSILLMLNGVSSLLNGNQISASNIGIGVMLFSVLVTIALVSFQTYIVKRTGSMAIKADSLHYRTDIFMNGAVLLALILAGLGWHWADGLFAIMVSFYILHGAWEIGAQSIDALMDKQLPKSDQELIIKAAYKIKDVRGVHDLRTRQSGNTKFIQLHLELDDDQSLFEAHEKADTLEAELEKHFPHADILIHLDPLSVVNVDQQRFTFDNKPENSAKDD
ncbi:divalent metal cation transporter FieF [Psychromonas sp. psych-6C06]|uniref:cation diffusion facilitator family transporter n=1 Tax=Psychromonas sp. psych-6C06 TaxID=2058089 RepID=UPI000C33A99B|nr:cation diffusion facilitator family transporter [Psychromonas sp. psych-6C06]PKF63024.1 divalent metal cation transporter FieF [Psychromonas sp. psych-6C06]